MISLIAFVVSDIMLDTRCCVIIVNLGERRKRTRSGDPNIAKYFYPVNFIASYSTLK